MKPKKPIVKGLIVVALIVVAILALAIAPYNRLVGSDEAVKKAWSNVESAYHRRADLIPNLVATVKGYAKHESETLTKLTELRSSFAQAKTPDEYEAANQKLHAMVNVVVEAYPNLKANENFLSLQDELAGTENRINTARRDYNQAVAAFNTQVRRFPTNIIAGLFGFHARTGTTAPAGANTAPSVGFGS